MSYQCLILIAIVSLLTCSSYHLGNNPSLINEINSMNTTWKAGFSKRFMNTPMSSIKTLLGSQLMTEREVDKYKKHIISMSSYSESFDLREEYPECSSLREIKDQNACGSSWAVAAAEVMSDRICILSNQSLQPKISSVHLISCCTICGQGCNGGNPTMAFMYWHEKGIPTGGAYEDKKTCQPYVFPRCDHKLVPGPFNPCGTKPLQTPKCEEECIEEYDKSLKDDLWFGNEAYMVGPNEYEIMTEIYQKGSVTASFIVYEDFALYKEGVYQHVAGELLGGHAVKIIGWGVENGVKYWLCANSWNDNWGDKGFFKILKGENHLEIEDNISAGIPKLKSFHYIE